MSEKIEPECVEHCPYKDIIGFEGLARVCEGRRVRLDVPAEDAYDEDDNLRGEVGRIVCGSKLSTDKNIPSVSLQDWAETTLTLAQLAELQRQGRFN